MGSDAANEVVDKYPHRALIFYPKVMSLRANGVGNEPSADGAESCRYYVTAYCLRMDSSLSRAF